MSIARHINYFVGKPGHEFVLVYETETKPVTGSVGYDEADGREDFLGAITKAPKTQWGGIIKLARGGHAYFNDKPTPDEAIETLRTRAQEMRAENERYETDPEYALEVELKSHDWYHAMSDDGSVYRAGARHWDIIRGLLGKVDRKRAEELYVKYAPKDFRFPL